MSSLPKPPPFRVRQREAGCCVAERQPLRALPREKVGTERGYPGIHSPSQKNRRLRATLAVWPLSRGRDDLGQSHEETIGLGRTGVNLL